MLYNKNDFTKINDKKVLHKVRKQWIIISLALLGVLGTTGAGTTIKANADENNGVPDDANHSSQMGIQTDNTPQSTIVSSDQSQNTQNNNANSLTPNSIMQGAQALHNQILRTPLNDNLQSRPSGSGHQESLNKINQTVKPRLFLNQQRFVKKPRQTVKHEVGPRKRETLSQHIIKKSGSNHPSHQLLDAEDGTPFVGDAMPEFLTLDAEAPSPMVGGGNPENTAEKISLASSKAALAALQSAFSSEDSTFKSAASSANYTSLSKNANSVLAALSSVVTESNISSLCSSYIAKDSASLSFLDQTKSANDAALAPYQSEMNSNSSAVDSVLSQLSSNSAAISADSASIDANSYSASNNVKTISYLNQKIQGGALDSATKTTYNKRIAALTSYDTSLASANPNPSLAAAITSLSKANSSLSNSERSFINSYNAASNSASKYLAFDSKCASLSDEMASLTAESNEYATVITSATQLISKVSSAVTVLNSAESVASKGSQAATSNNATLLSSAENLAYSAAQIVKAVSSTVSAENKMIDTAQTDVNEILNTTGHNHDSDHNLWINGNIANVVNENEFSDALGYSDILTINVLKNIKEDGKGVASRGNNQTLTINGQYLGKKWITITSDDHVYNGKYLGMGNTYRQINKYTILEDNGGSFPVPAGTNLRVNNLDMFGNDWYGALTLANGSKNKITYNNVNFVGSQMIDSRAADLVLSGNDYIETVQGFNAELPGDGMDNVSNYQEALTIAQMEVEPNAHITAITYRGPVIDIQGFANVEIGSNANVNLEPGGSWGEDDVNGTQNYGLSMPGGGTFQIDPNAKVSIIPRAGSLLNGDGNYAGAIWLPGGQINIDGGALNVIYNNNTETNMPVYVGGNINIASGMLGNTVYGGSMSVIANKPHFTEGGGNGFGLVYLTGHLNVNGGGNLSIIANKPNSGFYLVNNKGPITIQDPGSQVRLAFLNDTVHCGNLYQNSDPISAYSVIVDEGYGVYTSPKDLTVSKLGKLGHGKPYYSINMKQQSDVYAEGPSDINDKGKIIPKKVTQGVSDSIINGLDQQSNPDNATVIGFQTAPSVAFSDSYRGNTTNMAGFKIDNPSKLEGHLVISKPSDFTAPIYVRIADGGSDTHFDSDKTDWEINHQPVDALDDSDAGASRQTNGNSVSNLYSFKFVPVMVEEMKNGQPVTDTNGKPIMVSTGQFQEMDGAGNIGGPITPKADGNNQSGEGVYTLPFTYRLSHMDPINNDNHIRITAHYSVNTVEQELYDDGSTPNDVRLHTSNLNPINSTQSNQGNEKLNPGGAGSTHLGADPIIWQNSSINAQTPQAISHNPDPVRFNANDQTAFFKNVWGQGINFAFDNTTHSMVIYGNGTLNMTTGPTVENGAHVNGSSDSGLNWIWSKQNPATQTGSDNSAIQNEIDKINQLKQNNWTLYIAGSNGVQGVDGSENSHVKLPSHASGLFANDQEIANGFWGHFCSLDLHNLVTKNSNGSWAVSDTGFASGQKDDQGNPLTNAAATGQTSDGWSRFISLDTHAKGDVDDPNTHLQFLFLPVLPGDFVQQDSDLGGSRSPFIIQTSNPLNGLNTSLKSGQTSLSLFKGFQPGEIVGSDGVPVNVMSDANYQTDGSSLPSGTYYATTKVDIHLQTKSGVNFDSGQTIRMPIMLTEFSNNPADYLKQAISKVDAKLLNQFTIDPHQNYQVNNPSSSDPNHPAYLNLLVDPIPLKVNYQLYHVDSTGNLTTPIGKAIYTTKDADNSDAGFLTPIDFTIDNTDMVVSEPDEQGNNVYQVKGFTQKPNGKYEFIVPINSLDSNNHSQTSVIKIGIKSAEHTIIINYQDGSTIVSSASVSGMPSWRFPIASLNAVNADSTGTLSDQQHHLYYVASDASAAPVSYGSTINSYDINVVSASSLVSNAANADFNGITTSYTSGFKAASAYAAATSAINDGEKGQTAEGSETTDDVIKVAYLEGSAASAATQAVIKAEGSSVPEDAKQSDSLGVKSAYDAAASAAEQGYVASNLETSGSYSSAFNAAYHVAVNSEDDADITSAWDNIQYWSKSASGTDTAAVDAAYTTISSASVAVSNDNRTGNTVDETMQTKLAFSAEASANSVVTGSEAVTTSTYTSQANSDYLSMNSKASGFKGKNASQVSNMITAASGTLQDLEAKSANAIQMVQQASNAETRAQSATGQSLASDASLASSAASLAYIDMSEASEDLHTIALDENAVENLVDGNNKAAASGDAQAAAGYAGQAAAYAGEIEAENSNASSASANASAANLATLSFSSSDLNQYHDRVSNQQFLEDSSIASSANSVAASESAVVSADTSEIASEASNAEAAAADASNIAKEAEPTVAETAVADADAAQAKTDADEATNQHKNATQALSLADSAAASADSALSDVASLDASLSASSAELEVASAWNNISNWSNSAAGDDQSLVNSAEIVISNASASVSNDNLNPTSAKAVDALQQATTAMIAETNADHAVASSAANTTDIDANHALTNYQSLSNKAAGYQGPNSVSVTADITAAQAATTNLSAKSADANQMNLLASQQATAAQSASGSALSNDASLASSAASQAYADMQTVSADLLTINTNLIAVNEILTASLTAVEVQSAWHNISYWSSSASGSDITSINAADTIISSASVAISQDNENVNSSKASDAVQQANSAMSAEVSGDQAVTSSIVGTVNSEASQAVNNYSAMSTAAQNYQGQASTAVEQDVTSASTAENELSAKSNDASQMSLIANQELTVAQSASGRALSQAASLASSAASRAYADLQTVSGDLNLINVKSAAIVNEDHKAAIQNNDSSAANDANGVVAELSTFSGDRSNAASASINASNANLAVQSFSQQDSSYNNVTAKAQLDQDSLLAVSASSVTASESTVVSNDDNLISKDAVTAQSAASDAAAIAKIADPTSAQINQAQADAQAANSASQNAQTLHQAVVTALVSADDAANAADQAEAKASSVNASLSASSADVPVNSAWSNIQNWSASASGADEAGIKAAYNIIESALVAVEKDNQNPTSATAADAVQQASSAMSAETSANSEVASSALGTTDSDYIQGGTDFTSMSNQAAGFTGPKASLVSGDVAEASLALSELKAKSSDALRMNQLANTAEILVATAQGSALSADASTASSAASQAYADMQAASGELNDIETNAVAVDAIVTGNNTVAVGKDASAAAGYANAAAGYAGQIQAENENASSASSNASSANLVTDQISTADLNKYHNSSANVRLGSDSNVAANNNEIASSESGVVSLEGNQINNDASDARDAANAAALIAKENKPTIADTAQAYADAARASNDASDAATCHSAATTALTAADSAASAADDAQTDAEKITVSLSASASALGSEDNAAASLAAKITSNAFSDNDQGTSIAADGATQDSANASNDNQGVKTNASSVASYHNSSANDTYESISNDASTQNSAASSAEIEASSAATAANADKMNAASLSAKVSSEVIAGELSSAAIDVQAASSAASDAIQQSIAAVTDSKAASSAASNALNDMLGVNSLLNSLFDSSEDNNANFAASNASNDASEASNSASEADQTNASSASAKASSADAATEPIANSDVPKYGDNPEAIASLNADKNDAAMENQAAHSDSMDASNDASLANSYASDAKQEASSASSYAGKQPADASDASTAASNAALDSNSANSAFVAGSIAISAASVAASKAAADQSNAASLDQSLSNSADQAGANADANKASNDASQAVSDAGDNYQGASSANNLASASASETSRHNQKVSSADNTLQSLHPSTDDQSSLTSYSDNASYENSLAQSAKAAASSDNSVASAAASAAKLDASNAKLDAKMNDKSAADQAVTSANSANVAASSASNDANAQASLASSADAQAQADESNANQIINSLLSRNRTASSDAQQAYYAQDSANNEAKSASNEANVTASYARDAASYNMDTSSIAAKARNYGANSSNLAILSSYNSQASSANAAAQTAKQFAQEDSSNASKDDQAAAFDNQAASSDAAKGDLTGVDQEVAAANSANAAASAANQDAIQQKAVASLAASVAYQDRASAEDLTNSLSENYNTEVQNASQAGSDATQAGSDAGNESKGASLSRSEASSADANASLANSVTQADSQSAAQYNNSFANSYLDSLASQTSTDSKIAQNADNSASDDDSIANSAYSIAQNDANLASSAALDAKTDPDNATNDSSLALSAARDADQQNEIASSASNAASIAASLGSSAASDADKAENSANGILASTIAADASNHASHAASDASAAQISALDNSTAAISAANEASYADSLYQADKVKYADNQSGLDSLRNYVDSVKAANSVMSWASLTAASNDLAASQNASSASIDASLASSNAFHGDLSDAAKEDQDASTADVNASLESSAAEINDNEINAESLSASVANSDAREVNFSLASSASSSIDSVVSSAAQEAVSDNNAASIAASGANGDDHVAVSASINASDAASNVTSLKSADQQKFHNNLSAMATLSNDNQITSSAHRVTNLEKQIADAADKAAYSAYQMAHAANASAADAAAQHNVNLANNEVKLASEDALLASSESATASTAASFASTAAQSADAAQSNAQTVDLSLASSLASFTSSVANSISIEASAHAKSASDYAASADHASTIASTAQSNAFDANRDVASISDVVASKFSSNSSANATMKKDDQLTSSANSVAISADEAAAVADRSADSANLAASAAARLAASDVAKGDNQDALAEDHSAKSDENMASSADKVAESDAKLASSTASVAENIDKQAKSLLTSLENVPVPEPVAPAPTYIVNGISFDTISDAHDYVAKNLAYEKRTLSNYYQYDNVLLKHAKLNQEHGLLLQQLRITHGLRMINFFDSLLAQNYHQTDSDAIISAMNKYYLEGLENFNVMTKKESHQHLVEYLANIPSDQTTDYQGWQIIPLKAHQGRYLIPIHKMVLRLALAHIGSSHLNVGEKVVEATGGPWKIIRELEISHDHHMIIRYIVRVPQTGLLYVVTGSQAFVKVSKVHNKRVSRAGVKARSVTLNHFGSGTPAVEGKQIPNLVTEPVSSNPSATSVNNVSDGYYGRYRSDYLKPDLKFKPINGPHFKDDRSTSHHPGRDYHLLAISILAITASLMTLGLAVYSKRKGKTK